MWISLQEGWFWLNTVDVNVFLIKLDGKDRLLIFFGCGK